MNRIKTKPLNALRIITFNVHFAKRPLALAGAILNNPHLKEGDVFLLQEVEHKEHEGFSRAHLLAQNLGMDAVYTPARTTRGSDTHGLAIVSKYPILESQSISIPFYNLGFRSRQRIAVYTKIIINTITIGIYNVHLDTRLNSEDRISQLATVLTDSASRGDVCSLVGGDLNTIPVWWMKRVLPVFYSNQHKHLNDFLATHNYTSPKIRGFTMGQGLVRFKLDAIYSRGLPVVGWGIEKNIKVSDHKPLWVDVALPPFKTA